MEPQSETTQTTSALKLPVLKTGEYDLWSMRMEQYLTFTDHALWEVIVNGDSVSPIALASTGVEGCKVPYGKLSRIGLEANKGIKENEDANLKLLRSLPSAWNNIALIMRNKSDLDTLSMDDLYNNLKSNALQLDYEDLEQIDADDLKEIDLNGKGKHIIELRGTKESMVAMNLELSGLKKASQNFAQKAYNIPRNFVPTAVATKSGQVLVNATKQSSPRPAASISTTRLVNTVAPKPKVNDALPITYSYFKAHSPVNNVTTAGPKAVVSAIEGNGENAIKMKGIKREFSVARTPQQNRVAKRKNMTLIEAAMTMLADSLLPTTFWDEAVNTACYDTKPYIKLGSLRSVHWDQQVVSELAVKRTVGEVEQEYKPTSAEEK
ncbi:ribonuclease H-like domain-containing protein [Tanacetum coccineum]